MDTISKMDIVQEILVFSEPMMTIRLIPKEDPRYEMVKTCAEQKILFFMLLEIVTNI